MATNPDGTLSLDGGRTNYRRHVAQVSRAQFQPYRSTSSGRRISEIFDDANINNYFGFGPHPNAAAPTRLVADPLSRYDAFLRQLVKLERIDILPARDAFRHRPVPGRTVCVIRHDIDGDVVSALEMASMEHAYGISSTFNVLHTAPYYGRFGKRPSPLDRWPLRYLWRWVRDRRRVFFLRNEAMIEVYRRIQSLGHEIGLHVDGLHIYQAHHIDGAAAVREELAWLRRNGVRIVGMAPHNSAETYGAANSGLFTHRPPRDDVPAGPLSFERDGVTIPLQVLDEADCGFDYEIDDLYQLQPTDFLSAIGHGDWWFHRVYPKSMTAPADEFKALFPSPRRHHLCQEQVLDHLAGRDCAGQVVLAVHPEHFGLRFHPLNGPLPHDRDISAPDAVAAIRRERRQAMPDEFDVEPADIRSGHAGGLIEFQTIVTRNEAGLHDFPVAGIENADLKLVLIGKRQFGTETLAPGARVGGRLHRKLALETGREVRVATFATPDEDEGISLEKLAVHLDPRVADVIVLGIDLIAPATSAATATDADWRRFVERQRSLIEPLKGIGADLILVIEAAGSTAADLAEMEAARLASEFGVTVINPLPAFAARRSASSTLWSDGSDWSVLGHEIVADLICAAIRGER